MCGICGIYNYGRQEAVSADVLRRMTDLMIHRGPDSDGYHIDGNVGIGMRRLSIIDLTTGQQPIGNENDTIWVVCNGEIYNFKPLREDLQRKGHIFKTQSDSEVIVHLYEQYGKNCVSKLRGMFAFALWDKNLELIFCGRDRIGKKPFNYFISNGQFAFASELRSLLAVGDISREIDCEAVDLYLTLQYIPSPRTIYKAIKKLPPAHTITIQNGIAKVESYWDLPVNQQKLNLSLQETKEQIVAG